jgi:hypothetical protein
LHKIIAEIEQVSDLARELLLNESLQSTPADAVLKR